MLQVVDWSSFQEALVNDETIQEELQTKWSAAHLKDSNTTQVWLTGAAVVDADDVPHPGGQRNRVATPMHGVHQRSIRQSRRLHFVATILERGAGCGQAPRPLFSG